MMGERIPLFHCGPILLKMRVSSLSRQPITSSLLTISSIKEWHFLCWIPYHTVLLLFEPVCFDCANASSSFEQSEKAGSLSSQWVFVSRLMWKSGAARKLVNNGVNFSFWRLHKKSYLLLKTLYVKIDPEGKPKSNHSCSLEGIFGAYATPSTRICSSRTSQPICFGLWRRLYRYILQCKNVIIMVPSYFPRLYLFNI